ncbi:hypothetical protein P389DRAFT_34549 [Cystobasidium minutum MCA 4210]|uniref:uncharacterized protein n=1 Tax=Cystobasidium minutum MCA 4210 TaxID=1397322 RepID=UPI0034CEC3C7|eukprot:jgi/Rhomi1/34549/CE34548_169
MAITYTPARQRTFVASSSRSHGAPMDLDYGASPFAEPPRKRTHYDANVEMDWEPHPAVPRPSAMFSAASNNIASNNNGGTGTGVRLPSTAHSSGFLASASKDSPFLFHTSAMQLDEPPKADAPPVASTSSATSQPADHVESTTAPSAEDKHITAAGTRDIANGAVQRERRKREQLKNWQIAKGKGVQVEDDDNAGDGEEDTIDEVDTSFMESLSLSAPIKGLLRRTRSSRRRGEHAPLHLSLHHHNYHWPHNGQEPFQFGALSTNQQHAASSSPSPAPPSGWWHSDMPYVLLGYLQFGFNTSLILVSLALLLWFLVTLQHDVAQRVSEYSIELQQEIMHCSSNYISNRCQPGERVPAMEAMCKQWEFCMNKDPKVVNKLRVAAEVMAEVVNGFVEIISWRTMAFLLATLFIVVAYTNRTIATYRQQQHSSGRDHPHYSSISSSSSSSSPNLIAPNRSNARSRGPNSKTPE